VTSAAVTSSRCERVCVTYRVERETECVLQRECYKECVTERERKRGKTFNRSIKFNNNMSFDIDESASSRFVNAIGEKKDMFSLMRQAVCHLSCLLQILIVCQMTRS
jgi:hypothetical protein